MLVLVLVLVLVLSEAVLGSAQRDYAPVSLNERGKGECGNRLRRENGADDDSAPKRQVREHPP